MGPWRILLLSLCFLIIVPARAPALDRPAYIDGVALGRGPRGDLLVSFRVQNAFVPGILDTLESGLPIRFTFWIRVDRPRKWRPDEVLADLRIERVLDKDNLKNRYRITYEDHRTVRYEADLARAVAAMARVDKVSVLPLDALGGDPPPYLRIKARLQEFRLPFRLHYLLPFVSFWDVETEWYVLEIPRSIP